MMKKLLLLFLLSIVILTSCSSKEQVKAPEFKIYVVSDAEASSGNVAEEKVHTFVVDGKESYDTWYVDETQRRQMLVKFRNEFETKKEDFEAEKRSRYRNVRAVIDGEMIFGYEEALDLDKTYGESLAEPDVKSDSIYATQSGKGGGFVEDFAKKNENFYERFTYNDINFK